MKKFDSKHIRTFLFPKFVYIFFPSLFLPPCRFIFPSRGLGQIRSCLSNFPFFSSLSLWFSFSPEKKSKKKEKYLNVLFILKGKKHTKLIFSWRETKKEKRSLLWKWKNNKTKKEERKVKRRKSCQGERCDAMPKSDIYLKKTHVAGNHCESKATFVSISQGRKDVNGKQFKGINLSYIIHLSLLYSYLHIKVLHSWDFFYMKLTWNCHWQMKNEEREQESEREMEYIKSLTWISRKLGQVPFCRWQITKTMLSTEV